MKNFDFKKILDDFKEIFASTNNLKLILTLVLVLFILLFTVFGGCTGCGCSGCIDVSCHSCGSAGENGPESTPEIGADTGSDNAEAQPISFYEGSEIAYYPVALEEEDVALTFRYPADIYSYTENTEEFWADWCGIGMLSAEGKFAIQTEFEYVYNGWNSVTGAVPTTIEEAMEAHRANALAYSEPIGMVNVGGKDCLWRELGGYVMVFVPFEHNSDVFAVLNILPDNLDQNASDTINRAVELIYSDEVRAILSAVKISDLNGISDDTSGVEFSVVPFADTAEIGAKLSWPSLGGTVYTVDQTTENGSCKLRLDSVEIAQDAYGQDIVAFNLEFTNQGDTAICLGDVFYTCGSQGYSLGVTGDITGSYIPVAPGRCIAYQETYTLDAPGENIYFEVNNLTKENGELIFSDDSVYIDAYIAE